MLEAMAGGQVTHRSKHGRPAYMIEGPDPIDLRNGSPRVQVSDRAEQMNRSVNAAIGSDSELVRGGGMLDFIVELLCESAARKSSESIANS